MDQWQSDCGGAAEIKSYGLTAASIPLHCLGGGGRRGWKEGVFCLRLVLTALVC